MTTHSVIANALPIVAMAIGRKLDVEVRIDGSRARTDGKTIWLPSLPAEGEDLSILAYGWLDHEAAHVRYSDMEAFNRLTKPVEREFTNVFEDIRIENEIVKPYPGIRGNLNRLREKMVQEGMIEAASMSDHPAKIVQRYLLQRLNVELLGRESLTEIARETERVFRETVSAGVATKIGGLLAETAELGSTGDAVRLAKRVVALLEEESEEPEAPETSPAQPEDGESEGASDDSSNTMTDEQRQTLKQILEADSGDFDKDINAAVAEQLESEAQKATGGSGVGMGKASEALDSRVNPAELLSRIRQSSIALRRRLTGLVRSFKREQASSPRAGRRLNRRKLHRLDVGDPNVFLRKRIRPGVDTAVVLLGDRSSSMNGAEIEVLRDAMMAASLAIDAIDGVNMTVAAFPGHRAEVEVMTRFDERAEATAHYYAGLTASGGTPIGEAMWWAADQLVQRPEPRKMMIVFTDGEINPNDVKDVIRLCQRSGFEVYGIGIGSAQVEKYFPIAAHIRQMSELTPALFGLLQHGLTKAA